MISGFPRVGRICIGSLVSLSVSALGNVPGRQNDAQGRLVRSTRTGQPATLVAYNELGEQVAQAQDLNGNGVIDYAGPDRVAGSATGYVQQDGIWWQESRSLLYPASGDDTPMTVATRRARLTGLGATSDLGALASEQVSLDLLGNETVRRTWVDRSAKKVSQTADAPDSTFDAVQTAVNGLVLTNATATGVVTVYGYDDLGRQVTASSVSDGGARTVGQTLVYNARGQIASVTDAAGNATAFAYDAAGRQSAVINALGQVTRTAYDAEGRVLATWGATYPVAYEYDVFGRMTAMATTRDPAHESLDLWTLVPAGQTLSDLGPLTSDLDVTKWQYDLATGLVTNKVYADGKGTAYAYTADGKLARRTWARGVTTDYGYTPAGELETVNYSDATPDVTYAHDRLGRPVTIADVTGTRTNVYDVATLALAQEKLAGGLTLTRSQDVLGRSAGISMPDYSVEYGYDDYGRFGSVTANVNATTNVFAYGYVQGSDMLVGWSSNGGMSFHRTFEPNRDLVASITNAWNGVAVSSFAYTNDEIGRRTARVDSGSTQNSFGYNIRSEVVEAIMGAHTYGYEYDPIGNRLASTNDTAAVSYAANLLNQYTNIVSGATITPTYDDDGNMTTYGGWGFTWNGENRLIAATNAAHQVGYRYDYQGRMIEKTTDAATTSYLWDGFSIIAETDADGTCYNVWGLDLSGTPQGAGGVGGLLCCSSGALPPEVFFPAYDANGNITEYVNSAGSIVATRTYSPFGETSAATGAADAFTHWWSTKPWDPVTGFNEYEFRMYHPGIGRWLTRDSISERGSINIYAMTGNSVIDNIDRLGLQGMPGQAYLPPSMGGWNAPLPMEGPVFWTEDFAREVIAERIKEWETKGYMFAARLFRHFLEKKGPAQYIAQGDDIKEIKEHGAKYICSKVSEFIGNKTGVIHVDVRPENEDDSNVRWWPFISDPNMLYAYGGARLNVSGDVCVIQAGAWHARLNVSLRDDYTFVKPILEKWRQWGSELIDSAYYGAVVLQAQYGYKAFVHEEKFELQCDNPER